MSGLPHPFASPHGDALLPNRTGGGMTTEEALLTFQRERICHGGKCDLGCHACTAFMVRGEVLQDLAPIIERALRAAWSEGANDMVERSRSLHGKNDFTSDRGVTAGVAAMMEES